MLKKSDLDYIAEYLFDSLTEQEITEDESNIIVANAIEKLQSRFAGEQLYIPRKTADEITKRNELVISLFNGKNHSDLAKKFKVTTSRIYGIVKESLKDKQTSWLP